jgi:hypothetical protein
MAAAGAIRRRHLTDGDLDVLHWVMPPALYCHICMAIEIASDLLTFVVVVDSLLPTNIAIAKKDRNNKCKLKPRYSVVH